MLARLLLTLLMLALAVPSAAMPACHSARPAPASDQAMAVMPMHHHGMAPSPAPERHAMPDACLGCIAPATLGAPRLAPPRQLAPAPLAEPALHGAPLGHGPPATPPPRSAA